MSENPPAGKPPQSIRRQRALQVVFGVPMVTGFALALLQAKSFIEVEKFGLAETPFYFVCFSVCGLYFLVTFLTWRCPSCRGFLGRNFSPPFCPHCGTPLT
jgi:hypothetical protein